ncbi:MMPL family transporter [Paenibacillus sp. MMS18-CY102]|uniref:MMPL family transporter n=1 Tax=Paenibacillus sp. MMS18-CY102 TaxID=2682849 RepID=UPI0013657E7F|nr:MMPL family transporter [Paenibacillus sp. MMS18-CY102]MWC29927.1 MMPL family transporter [Paenibacillus sp. MMS18-CY102]
MDTDKGLSRYVAGKKGRWVTLLVWLAIAVILTLTLPSVGDQENNNAANLSDAKPSVQAAAVSDQEFPSGSSLPALLVLHREGGLKQADLESLQQLTAQWGANPLPHQTSVPPLHQLPLPALQQQLSKDGSTIVAPILFSKQADTDQLKESLDQLRADVNKRFGGDLFSSVKGDAEEGNISARLTGPVGIQVDATGLFKNADVSLLLATVLLVLIILLIIYRSPVLAFIPLIAVGFAYMVVGPILGWMAREGWITVDSQGISIMTVLLFGAGTDYCLFLISRFRQLLSTERDKGKALRHAITGSTGAIAMSGLTVVLSLLALLFAQYGAYHRFAVPFSLSILIMAIASLTLVPALLAIIGRASFYPFVPRTPEMIAERAQKRGKPSKPARQRQNSFIGRIVVRRPWTVVLTALIVLGTLAGFSSRIEVTYDILSSFPEDMESREGFTIIGEQFSPGELAPVQVIVDTKGEPVDLKGQLSKLPYVAQVSDPQQGKQSPNIVAVDVSLTMNPYSLEAMKLIPELRQEAQSLLAAAGDGQGAEDRVWIGGQTADQYDTKEAGDRDTAVIIPVVIGLITLLLLGYLRSVVATAYLIGTVILSYFSALGLGWLIIHYGLGADAIAGSIPLYSFVFLVALGEDYNIFMISSIWEKRKRMPLRRAISEGVSETGSVITSAGVILAGTFAVLASLPIQVLVHFGIVTAVGVLLDTFIVRPFLVPAITALLGRAAFWPGKHVEIAEEPQVTGQA